MKFFGASLCWISSFFATLILLLTGGCRCGSRAQPIDFPSHAIEAALDEAAPDPLFDMEQRLQRDWWGLFHDEQLAHLIEIAFEQNPTLHGAYERILLAATNANKARAVLFPSLTWGADISRQKLSETGIIPFKQNGPTVGGTPQPATGGVAGIPVYFTQYETEFILNFDFDIWGKNRNTWRAALSEVQAKIADEAFSRLQLGISVAQVYFRLQVDYKRREIARALVESFDKYLGLINRRVQSQLENLLAIHVAENNLVQSRQTLLQIEGDIAVLEYQLKTYLAGNFEEEIFKADIFERIPRIPLPKEIPLHLLAHRPDITAQLWLIESAGHQIEAARAGFYPDFNLTAIYGYQTIHFRKLFNWPSTYFNVDPAFSLPIFDGGRLMANLQGSEVNYDYAIYQYNLLVLDAVRDVLTGIAVLRNAVDQLQEFQKQVRLQEELFTLTNLRKAHNLSSEIDYLISEQNVLAAKDQEMVALGNTYQSILLLIKALGGGYDACDGDG
jgi:NodT family efflux transporter outer membrane factor (OMF) lipoprotein